MVHDINQELQSGDENRILSALYDLSGDERSFSLDVNSISLIPKFLSSSNEDIVWRSIFFFGIVKPNPILADYIVDVARKWAARAPHIVLASIDSLARMLDVGVLGGGRCGELASDLVDIPKVDLARVFDLQKLCDGCISYKEYVERARV